MTVALNPAVAEHFTQDERSEAASFLVKHEAELPKAGSGSIIYPDALQKQIARELRRITEKRRLNVARDEDAELTVTRDENADEQQPARSDVDADGPGLSDEDYEALVESAPDTICRSQEMQEVLARLEAAAVASRHKPRRDRSAERFMATADGYVEPYLAIRNGMALGRAAQTFKLASVKAYVASIETWLSMMEVAIPHFDREVFLARLERAIDKRRSDATQRAKPDPPRVVVVGDLPDRGFSNLPLSTPAKKALARKRDLPWSGEAAKPWQPAVMAKKDTQDEPRRDMLDAWVGTTRPDAARAVAITSPPSHEEMYKRQLERGLIALLDVMPFSEQSRELVRIVDLAQEGKSQREIASALGIDRGKIARLLALVSKAADASPLCGQQIGTPEALFSENVTPVESVNYAAF